MDKTCIDNKLKSFIFDITKGKIENPREDFNLTSFQMLSLVSKIEDHFSIEVEDRLIYRKLAKSYDIMLDYVQERLKEIC